MRRRATVIKPCRAGCARAKLRSDSGGPLCGGPEAAQGRRAEDKRPRADSPVQCWGDAGLRSLLCQRCWPRHGVPRATWSADGRRRCTRGSAAARALARYHVHTAPQVFIHVHQLKSPVKFRPNALHDAHRPPTSHQSHRPPAGRPVLWANGRWWQVGRGANLSAGHPSRPLKTAQAHISQK